jgi:hypothetical protein
MRKTGRFELSISRHLSVFRHGRVDTIFLFKPPSGTKTS